jgi:hypothetical protein
MNNWVNLHALWQIVVLGLITGAGLPALFAIGLRALTLPGDGAPRGEVVGGSRIGLTAASLCFAVVLAAVGWGIYFIVNSA